MWKFPILTLVKNQYKKLGLVKFTIWFIFIWIFTKLVIINGIILFADTVFGTNWGTPPVTSWMIENFFPF